MSKPPQTGQEWCWTSKEVSQPRQMYGSASLPESVRPDTDFALSSTPIATTCPVLLHRIKKRGIVYVIFSPRRLPVLRIPRFVAPIDAATATADLRPVFSAAKDDREVKIIRNIMCK